jgi:hypothetical protein
MDLFTHNDPPPKPVAAPAATLSPEDVLVQCVRVHFHMAEYSAKRMIACYGPEWRRVALQRIAAGKTTAATLFDPADKWHLRA